MFNIEIKVKIYLYQVILKDNHLDKDKITLKEAIILLKNK